MHCSSFAARVHVKCCRETTRWSQTQTLKWNNFGAGFGYVCGSLFCFREYYNYKNRSFHQASCFSINIVVFICISLSDSARREIRGLWCGGQVDCTAAHACMPAQPTRHTQLLGTPLDRAGMTRMGYLRVHLHYLRVH